MFRANWPSSANKNRKGRREKKKKYNCICWLTCGWFTSAPGLMCKIIFELIHRSQVFFFFFFKETLGSIKGRILNLTHSFPIDESRFAWPLCHDAYIESTLCNLMTDWQSVCVCMRACAHVTCMQKVAWLTQYVPPCCKNVNWRSLIEA